MNRAAILAGIKRRFAGRDPAIERVFAASESFRGLCADYLACASVFTRWQQSEAVQAPRRVAEYGELLAELTQEIERRLGAEEGMRSRQPPLEGKS